MGRAERGAIVVRRLERALVRDDDVLLVGGDRDLHLARARRRAVPVTRTARFVSTGIAKRFLAAVFPAAQGHQRNYLFSGTSRRPDRSEPLRSGTSGRNGSR